MKQSRKRPDLFSQDDIAIIFCNIEDILKLHEQFFEKLRRRVNKRDLFKTEIGDLFISHVSDNFLLFILLVFLIPLSQECQFRAFYVRTFASVRQSFKDKVEILHLFAYK